MTTLTPDQLALLGLVFFAGGCAMFVIVAAGWGEAE